MEKPNFAIAVVMQRRAVQSRWIDHVWEPWGVVPGFAEKGEPRMLVDEPGVQQWLHPGYKLVLHRDECEGYYLNVSIDHLPAPIRRALRDRSFMVSPPIDSTSPGFRLEGGLGWCAGVARKRARCSSSLPIRVASRFCAEK